MSKFRVGQALRALRVAMPIAVVCVSATGASPAQAGLLGNVLGGVTNTVTTTVSTTTTNAIPAVGGLLTGQQGLLGTTQQLLCPTASSLDTLLNTTPGLGDLGLGTIGQGLSSLLCSAGLLEYRFETTYARPGGGTVARSTLATVGVPTPLNVDDDILPDLIGTITITGPNQVGVKIERSPTETATLPVAVQAVLNDATHKTLGRGHLAFGYDARTDRAPGTFTLSTPLDTLLKPNGSYHFDLTQQQRGNAIAVTAGLFDGTFANPVNPTEVRLEYGAAPDTAAIDARVGTDLAATLTTNRTGPAKLTGRVVAGQRQDRFAATITNLPSTLGLTARTSGDLHAVYTASARVASIRAFFATDEAGATRQKSIVNLDDVPTGITADIAGSHGTITTTGGPIGQTEVGVANGEPRLLTGEPAYVNSDDDGSVSSTALRVPGLERAAFDLGDAPTISAKLAATPLFARLHTPDQTITARVQNLPHEFDLGLDVNGGRVTYDGHGTGIGKITLAGDATRPFFGRATKLRGTLTSIPATMTATLTQADGTAGLTIEGSGAIGTVEFLASNGSELLPPGTGDGAIYRDLSGGDYLIAARVHDLREVSVHTTGAAQLKAVTRGGPFSLALATDDLQADGTITDLPAQATFGLDQAAGKLTFTGADAAGHPQGIQRLALTAHSGGGGALFGRADRIDAVIRDLPASLELGFQPAGEDVTVSASNPIGSIEVVAANRVIDRAADLPPGDGQGIRYIDHAGGDYVVAARVLGLERIAATLSNPISVATRTAGGPFRADIDTDALSGSARIADLPARATVTADLDQGRVTFSGRDASGGPAGIDTLDVDLHATGPLFGRADTVHAHVEEIPADLTLDLAQGAGGVDVSASNGGVGLVELFAGNRPQQPGDLPAGGAQGVSFTDLTGGDYAVAARVRHLKHLKADLGTPIRLQTETDGGPFAVRVVTDDLDAAATVQDLPAQLDATLDLDAGRLTVHGRNAAGDAQGIDLLTLDAHATQALFGGANYVKARIEKIAPDLTLDLAQAADGVKVTASDPIQTIELAAANRPVDLASDLPADGHQGATYVDREGTFLLAARVHDLQRIEVALNPSVALKALTGGGPFDVRVDTNDLHATGAFLDLPPSVDVALDAAAGRLRFAGREADGTTPKGIDSVQLHVAGNGPLFGRASRLDLDVVKLAPTVTIDLAAGGTGASIIADEPIQSITLGATSGADPVNVDAVLDTPQGAVFRDTPSEYTLAARLLDLEHVTVNLGGSDVGLSSKVRSTPFRALIQTPALNADAFIDQLPAETDLRADLGSGQISFDGHGSGVNRLAIDAHSDTPLFGRATDIHAAIDEVPSKVTLGLDTGASRASVVAGDDGDAAIGRLELLATDGATTFPSALADPDSQGAVYHDRAGAPFVIAARVRQLRKLAVDFSQNVGLETSTAGGPFSVDVDTDAIGAVANVLDLPAHATLGLELDTGHITFDGQNADGDPAGIDLLTVEARLAQPFLGAGNRVKARIEKLPAHVTLGFSQSNGAASLSADNPIQLIELQAWEDGKAEPALPADQGAILHDKAGEDFQLAARIRQLKALTINFGDAVNLHTETAGGLFTADISSDALTAQATIDQLPTVLDLGLNLTDGKVTYSGSAPVNLIHAAITSETPVFLGATNFAVDFRVVPTHFELGIGQDLNQSISLTSDQPIGQIDVSAGSPGRDAPVIADGEAGAKLDSTDGKLGLALRVFDLSSLKVDTAPIALEATMRPDIPFRVDAKLAAPVSDPAAPVDPNAPPLHVQADIENLPATFKVGLGDINPAGSPTTGGTKLTYQASSPVGRIHIKADGVALLEGADGIEADLAGVPSAFTMTLPEQPATGVKPPLAQLAVNPGEAIGELRLAAGSRTLPATGQATDVFSYTGDPANFGVAVRLTGVQGLAMNLDPVNLVLDQVAATTKKIDINASLPQDGGPDATITGALNKPSAHTEVGVTLPDPTATPKTPTRLLLRNGTPAAPGSMANLTLNIANLGTIPSATFSLDNVPRILDACLATDNTCRPADKIPAALSNYTQSTGFIKTFPDSSQNATAGGNNRPYAANVSMDFNDQGTSGTSSSIASMVTMNATIDLGSGGAPVQINNVRFHRLALDFGMNGQTFGYLGQTVPKFYMFIDSNTLPFVMNNISYPPSITAFKIGTDGSPANANKRLVWLPGRKSAGTALDSRASGSLACGGQQNLTSGGINLLNFPVIGQLVSVCG
ncbi:MAG: hypothetical protein JWO02_1745 [Solirubrobacterales bacterium]|nr:hypothetical protein [Solirubrobacterales bacterium]